MDKIYKITTEAFVDGSIMDTIAYATGNPEDIRQYFEPEKRYNLEVEEIKVVNVTPNSAKELESLRAQKKDLEKRIEEVNKKLEVYVP